MYRLMRNVVGAAILGYLAGIALDHLLDGAYECGYRDALVDRRFMVKLALNTTYGKTPCRVCHQPRGAFIHEKPETGCADPSTHHDYQSTPVN